MSNSQKEGDMILWLLFIAIDVYRNYYLIEITKSKPNYLHSFIIRGMASILHLKFMGVPDWQHLLIVLGFQVTSFWLIFDIALNIVRGKSWFYKGDNSGWLDRLKLPLYVILKVIVLVVLLGTIFGINVL